MLPRALVVTSNRDLRDEVMRWLLAAGYSAVPATDFKSARQELDTLHPELLISDVKLEAYNGLHLVIWIRGRGLSTRAVLIGEPDSVLQREAEREGAAFLSPPLQEAELLSVVSSILTRFRPARRSPRKQVTLDATVDGVPASVTDLSYEGLRIELSDAESIILPHFFTVRLPEFQIACRLQRVWTGRPAGAPGVLRCGAVFPRHDSPGPDVWRDLVDALPGSMLTIARSTARG